MKVSVLRSEIRVGTPLQKLLLHYTQALLAVISRMVACGEHHDLRHRLARVILQLHDYVQPRPILLPQSGIAMLLGTRRPAVSVVAAELQRAGIIRYSRGRIYVLNRKALRNAACECYQFTREQYASLITRVPALLAKPSFLGRDLDQAASIKRR